MKSEVIFVDNAYMTCPNCGGEHLHQDRCEVYWRQSEGGPSDTIISSTAESTKQSGVQDRNPSDKRDGVLIRFWCENCSAHPELAVYQHKGNTIVRWAYAHLPI